MAWLIACESSQVICHTARDRGIEAFSCDILPADKTADWHIQGCALKAIKSRKWEGMIAHPPCTFLTVTGNKWMKPEFEERFPTRKQDRVDAIDFFMKLFNADIPKIAVENPVGIMSTVFRKPDQYVHPYHFGDPHSKKTGLWLKNLTKLKSTAIVEPEFYIYKDGRRDPMWHVESMKMKPHERMRFRSKTYQGIANAVVDQWMVNK